MSLNECGSILPSASPALWATLVRNRRLPGAERGFAVYFAAAVTSRFPRRCLVMQMAKRARGEGRRGSSGGAAGRGVERNLDLHRLPSSSSPTPRGWGRIARHGNPTPPGRARLQQRQRCQGRCRHSRARLSRRNGQNRCRGKGAGSQLASSAKPLRERRRDVGMAAHPWLGHWHHRHQPRAGTGLPRGIPPVPAPAPAAFLKNHLF